MTSNHDGVDVYFILFELRGDDDDGRGSGRVSVRMSWSWTMAGRRHMRVFHSHCPPVPSPVLSLEAWTEGT